MATTTSSSTSVKPRFLQDVLTIEATSHDRVTRGTNCPAVIPAPLISRRKRYGYPAADRGLRSSHGAAAVFGAGRANHSRGPAETIAGSALLEAVFAKSHSDNPLRPKEGAPGKNARGVCPPGKRCSALPGSHAVGIHIACPEGMKVAHGGEIESIRSQALRRKHGVTVRQKGVEGPVYVGGGQVATTVVGRARAAGHELGLTM